MSFVSHRDGQAASQRRRRRWRRVVPVAALLLALLSAEMILRARDAQREREAWGFRMPDARRGWALQPGFRGRITGENDVWLEVNQDGLRDRDHARDKPAGTIRIAVLGDSYMQAVNLPFDKTFPPLLERQLDRCLQPAGRRAEVINFGVSGYSTAQELMTYQDHARQYRPDVVLLAFYTGNDVFDNHRELHESFFHDIPFFVLRDGQLVLDAPPAEPAPPPAPWYQHLRMAITERSVIAKGVWEGYALLRAPYVAPQMAEVARDAGVSESLRVYPPPSTPAVKTAWSLTEALLLELNREVRAQGAEFWIVTLSNAEQVHPDPALRAQLAAGLGVETLRYPDHRIRDFAEAHQIPMLMLVEPLAAYAEQHRVFLNGGYDPDFPEGTGHWNETAHRLAAGIVGDALCRDSPVLAK